jgi:threonine/homoserine/homoserine lactone efflux protein
MNVELLTALAVFAFVGSITPGPNTMLLLASGVNHGFRATVPLMTGISIGILVMLLAVGLGLGQAFAAVPVLYTLLKIVSAVYLLWLAWKIATASPVAATDAKAAPGAMTFMQGAGFQWVNPKAWIMCVTVASAYTVPQHYAQSLMIAALVFAVINVPSVMVWTGFGVSLRRLLADPRRVRIFNVAMALALAASLWPLVVEVAKAVRPV